MLSCRYRLHALVLAVILTTVTAAVPDVVKCNRGMLTEGVDNNSYRECLDSHLPCKRCELECKDLLSPHRMYQRPERNSSSFRLPTQQMHSGNGYVWLKITSTITQALWSWQLIPGVKLPTHHSLKPLTGGNCYDTKNKDKKLETVTCRGPYDVGYTAVDDGRVCKS